MSGMPLSRHAVADSVQTIPLYGIPSMSAYHQVRDTMNLDGNPTLDLVSRTHVWLPHEVTKLAMETVNKNAVDLGEYPALRDIHNGCISMFYRLWHGPEDGNATGTATGEPLQAVMLAILALKKNWQGRCQAAGRDHLHPNIVFGENAQIAFKEFAYSSDVEARLVPVHAETDVMHPPDVIQYIDEKTIGVIVTVGTRVGHLEDVQRMSDLLDDLQTRTGLNIPIHVDAASGGLIAPFVYPTLKWDFAVPRVVSTNTSGHKFGLPYPGLGWTLWRDEQHLHKKSGLVYPSLGWVLWRDENHLHSDFIQYYLGGTEYSSLNFSKPTVPIVTQAYNFLNLGFDGHREAAVDDLRGARLLSSALEETYFKVLSNVHRPASDMSGLAGGAAAAMSGVTVAGEDGPEFYQKGLPVVAFRLSDDFMTTYPHVQQVRIQNTLRERGWIVSNYAALPAEENVELLRVVVSETLSADLIERFIADILEITKAHANESHQD